MYSVQILTKIFIPFLKKKKSGNQKKKSVVMLKLKVQLLMI